MSMKFQMLIKGKMVTEKDISCFKAFGLCIYHAYRYQNANKCWHFKINDHDKFHAQLSWAWKKVYIYISPPRWEAGQATV